MTDSHSGIAPHHKIYLLGLLTDVRSTAIKNDLETMFDAELFHCEQAVTEALADNDEQAAIRASTRIRALDISLRLAPYRPSVFASSPSSRAQRGDPVAA